MIRMIVFDMAGTTIDEKNVVYKTLQKAINEKGYHLSLEEVLAQGAGKEKLQAIKDIVTAHGKKFDEVEISHMYKNFVTILEKAYTDLDVAPQDGAEEVFNALRKRNILVILNTGFTLATSRHLLKKLNWQEGKQIDGLVTSNDVQHGRPMPDMIHVAMQRFGISDPKETVKVGDSIIDIEEGKNAGCRLSIGITTGAHTREQLESAHPDYIINHLTELLSLVDKNNA